MREKILRLWAIASEQDPSLAASVPAFTNFDIGKLKIPQTIQVHPDVASYFATCVPQRPLDLGFHILLSPEEIELDNTEALPASLACPHGLVTFGNEPSQDALALDLESGRVCVLSHDSYEPEAGVVVGYDQERRRFIHTPLSHETFFQTAGKIYQSLDVFFDDWKRQLESA